MNRTFNQNGLIHTLPLLLIIAAVGIISFLLVTSTAPLTGLFGKLNPKPNSQAAFVVPTPIPGCPLANTTPVGQANPSQEYEPMGAIWCYPLSGPAQPTRIAGTNDWIDDFNINQQMTQIGEVMSPDGIMPKGNPYYGWRQSTAMDYNIFNNLITANDNSGLKTQGYLNANHWMFDMAPAKKEGGQLMSPNKSFKFENGKLVIEADVAAAIGDYPGGGADVFPEIDVSLAPYVTIGKSQTEIGRPCGKYASSGAGIFNWDTRQWQTGVCKPTDTLYGYGDFPGFWSFGCRLQNTRSPVCSMYYPTGDFNGCVGLDIPAGDNCLPGTRVFEFSPTEVGVHVNEFNLAGVPDQQSIWRKCPSNKIDYYCRDRFRIEIEKTQFTLFINGVKYFQMSIKPGATIAGLPAGQMFPNEMLTGNNYVYFTSWTSAFNPNPLTRFHWDRVTVNPHNADGTFQPPTTAPTFCLGQPGNACPVLSTGVGLIAPANNNVDILDFIYNQQNVVIAQGTAVTWTNKGTQPHSVTSDSSGLFDSGILNANQTYTHTFNTPGVYSYHCIPHPGMTGTVTVLGAGGSTPTPSAIPSISPSPTPVTVGTTFNLTMNGAKNVPVVTTNGTGSGTLILSTNETAATLTMSYSGLTSNANAAHIHGPASTTQNANVLFPLNFTAGLAGTNNTTTITGLTPAQVADLKNGLWYVNVHSVNFPNGEIRGQLLRPGQTPPPNPTPTPNPTPSAKVGDLDNDGDVDIFDYSTLVANFGKTGTNILGDLDNDGDVDIFDYSTLVANFGH